MSCLTGDSVVKNPPANAGDAGWIPRSGIGVGNGNPLQSFRVGNLMNRGDSQVIVHGVYM